MQKRAAVVRGVVNPEFGHEIRRRREALGLTLVECAKRCRLSPKYLDTIENGRRDVSWTALKKIAAGLGVSPGELIGAPELSAMAIEVGMMFEMLMPDARAAFLEVVHSVLREQETDPNPDEPGNDKRAN